MRKIGVLIAALAALSISAAAQGDPLQGRWEGKLVSPQGERPTAATFKKEPSGYTGTIVAMQRDLPLKEIKVDGDKVTAIAQVDTPQASVTINYTFKLEGEMMKGKGELDFNGNPVSFEIELKRVSADATAAASAAATPGPQARAQRPIVEQPKQPQSLDYFVGTWSYKVIGRESALGVAPREGTITFTKVAPARLEGRGAGKYDGGSLEETVTIDYDEAAKALTFAERRSNGVTIRSKGDWSSPISIRFAVEPVKIKGQTLQLRRTISVISGHSFSVTEELSEDGGPFVRLGQAIYSRAAN
jgi:hypothetical protein